MAKTTHVLIGKDPITKTLTVQWADKEMLEEQRKKNVPMYIDQLLLSTKEFETIISESCYKVQAE